MDVGESFDVKLFPVEVIPAMLLRGEFVQATISFLFITNSDWKSCILC